MVESGVDAWKGSVDFVGSVVGGGVAGGWFGVIRMYLSSYLVSLNSLHMAGTWFFVDGEERY